MRKAIIPAAIIVALAVVVFLGVSLIGRRSTVTEEKRFSDFTRVDLGGSFEAEIVQANSFNVTVSTRRDLLDYITVSQEGDTLRIYINPRQPFTDFTAIAKSFKARITMPALKELRLSGTTKVTVTGFKSANDFKLNESGASSLSVDKSEFGNVEFNVLGASKFSGNIKAKDAKFLVSGAGDVKLAGSAETIALNTSGATKINLTDFPTDTASINLSGASEATIQVKERLDVVLSDASRLYFKGNPVMGTTSISDASTIKHQ